MITIRKFEDLVERLFEAVEKKGYKGGDVSIDIALMDYNWAMKQIDDYKWIILYHQSLQETTQLSDGDEFYPPCFFIDKVDDKDIDSIWEDNGDDIMLCMGYNEDKQFTYTKKLENILNYNIVFHQLFPDSRQEIIKDGYIDLDKCTIVGHCIQLKDEKSLKRIIDQL
jgi:hypothetical protein